VLLRSSGFSDYGGDHDIVSGAVSGGGWRREVPAAGDRWRYPAVSILRIQGSLAANEYHHGHWIFIGFWSGPGRLKRLKLRARRRAPALAISQHHSPLMVMRKRRFQPPAIFQPAASGGVRCFGPAGARTLPGNAQHPSVWLVLKEVVNPSAMTVWSRGRPALVSLHLAPKPNATVGPKHLAPPDAQSPRRAI